MKKRSLNLSLACLTLALAACGEAPLADPTGDVDTLDSEIVNGEVDHDHATVGKIRMSGQEICTGTLVGARTVLCAAHCIMKPASAYAFVLGGKAYQARAISVHPGWSPDAEG